MADTHSFDIVCTVDLQEVDNAVNQAMREISQRFDFRKSKSNIVLDKERGIITLVSDDEHKLKSVVDILQTKLIKRNISPRVLSPGKVEPAAGDTVRQVVTLQQGIPQDKAKEIVKFIKTLKRKVTSEIQKEQVRVKAKKIDDLQAVMSAIKEEDFGIHFQFTNYR